MHTATQIIAQRAPPAIRTKTRWQPYHSMPASSALRSPTVSCHNTPTSFVQTQSDSSSKAHSQPSPPPLPQTPAGTSQRDASKHKFAAGLIDQAVNILSEIWRPQDVPDVFKAPSKSTTLASALGHATPLSPHQSFNNTPTPQTSISAIMAQQHTQFTPSASQTLLTASTESNLLPMKTFVHEVLKRSRTSGNILQAALCYLEAIRPKVPEILQQEKIGIRAHCHSETQILPATEAELAREAELAVLEDSFTSIAVDIDQEEFDETKTVRVTDSVNDDLDSMQYGLGDRASISSLSLIAEPYAPVDASPVPKPPKSLPSPLLCPRRAFLASLILASKFFQDKCYSNRAWAKLSGLPPREIGRCERALGQALEWRLWVGKSSVPRVLARSHSEQITFPSSQCSSYTSSSKLLRRCSTLPAEKFHQQITFIQTAFLPGSDNKISPELRRDDITLVSTWPTPRSAPSPQVIEKTALTPSPDTPALTYSPTSTDSSGDRTIQMSSYEDNMFPSSVVSQPWIDCLPAPVDGAFGLKVFGDSRTTKLAVSVAETELSSCRPEIGLWHADNQYITLESTNVH